MYIWKRLAKGDSRISEYVEVGVGNVLDVRDRRVPCASALATRKAGRDGKGPCLWGRWALVRAPTMDERELPSPSPASRGGRPFQE